MPGPLGRPTEDSDYLKDALVARMLVEAYEFSDSVRDEYVENALNALIEIMKLEGVDLESQFQDNEGTRIATRNALSEFVISGAMFNKTRNDGRHYFEGGFPRRAERLVRKHLSTEAQEAAQKALPSVRSVLILGRDWKACVADYKAERQAARA